MIQGSSALDGPRRPAKSGRARSLVVLLHGYGAHGEDLIGLADVWADRLPDTAFVSPNAPQPMPFPGMPCYQWFALNLRDSAEYWSGCTSAQPLLDAFLDAELAKLKLPASRMALVGFSQGCMMALHTGLRRASAPACIVGYSGRLAGPERIAADIRCRPPVLLVHGALDDLIPSDALTETAAALQVANVPVEWHERPDIGHEIDAFGLQRGAAFLAEHLSPA
jgi:phospholipase/carboxylesterase